jgi:multiple sugar transport system ATP-binding protein
MNFADRLAVARAGEGEAWLESDGRPLVALRRGGELDGRGGAGAIDLGRAVLGVRPEHVAVVPGDRSGQASAGVAGRVVDLVPEGRDLVVGLELGGGLELRSVVPSTLDLELGQTVAAVIDERYVHLFDRETGAALHHGAHARGRAAGAAEEGAG